MVDLRVEVDDLLIRIRKTLKCKRCNFIVSDRDKNNDFCIEYSLSSGVIRNIIKNLTIYDFNKVLDNSNVDYLEEKLYLFAPRVELVNCFGKKERIQLYLKINYIEKFNTIIIVSLHKSRYELRYAFK